MNARNVETHCPVGAGLPGRFRIVPGVFFWMAAATVAQPAPPESTGRVSFKVRPADSTVRVYDRKSVGSTEGPVRFGFFVRGVRPGSARDFVPPVLPQRSGAGAAAGPAAGLSGARRLRGAPEAMPLTVGDYLVEVSRPGYRIAFSTLAVAADEDVEVEVALKRESATLRLRTAPSGATVLVDGHERGRTAGTAAPGFVPDSSVGPIDREAFSAELWIDDLPAEPYRIEVRKEGFRAFSARLGGSGFGDDVLRPIVLEPELGTVALMGLPQDADVRVDGRLLSPDRQKWTPEALMPPGTRRITVSRGIHGYFETSVTVEDGGRVEVDVELRPALAVLGVFGSDEEGRGAVMAGVQAVRDDARYTVLDRVGEGAALLQEVGVDVSDLRSRAEASRVELDWKAVQERVQERLPAALYLVAVLDDDLVAEAVDLWWWPPAPGPARPAVRTMGIRNGRLEAGSPWRLVGAVDPAPSGRAPDLGAVLIESLAEGPLVAAAVEPGGPAHAAGLRQGVEIVAINGEEASLLGLSAALEKSGPGSVVELETPGDQGVTVLPVSPRWDWTPLDPFDPELLAPAAAAVRLRDLDGKSDVPRWLLELDLATLLLAGGDAPAAVARLETIEVADLDQAHAEVVQYALGLGLVALVEAGQETFRPRALAVLEELAFSDPARLQAMRARLRWKSSDTDGAVGWNEPPRGVP